MELLKWVRSEGCPWDEATCVLAAGTGHLEVLRWARLNGCAWAPAAFRWANQNITLLRFQGSICAAWWRSWSKALNLHVCPLPPLPPLPRQFSTSHWGAYRQHLPVPPRPPSELLPLYVPHALLCFIQSGCNGWSLGRSSLPESRGVSVGQEDLCVRGAERPPGNPQVAAAGGLPLGRPHVGLRSRDRSHRHTGLGAR